jgi:hypothetical protein
MFSSSRIKEVGFPFKPNNVLYALNPFQNGRRRCSRAAMKKQNGLNATSLIKGVKNKQFRKN